ncbi:MAG: hypothetical protein WD738_00875 [Pirellulales bacterium]
MSTILRNLFACMAILGVASAAPAAVLFSETFSYPDGHLASAPPDGGVSGGLWTVLQQTYRTTHSADVSNGKIALLQIQHYPSIPNPSGEDVYRGFSALAAGQTIYAGFDVTASGNDDYAVFADFVWPDGVYSAPATSLVIGPLSGSDFTFRIGYGLTGGVRWPSGLAFDTTYRVVMSYEFDTGSSKLWVNPASESSTNVSKTLAAYQSKPVSGFELRQDTLCCG